MARIEQLEGGGGQAPPSSTPAPAPTPKAEVEPPAPEPAKPEARAKPEPKAEAAPAAGGRDLERDIETASTTAALGVAIASVDMAKMVRLWPAVIDHMRTSGSEMLSSLFDGARPLDVDPERSTLRIGFPTSAKFNKRKAEAQANVERISESLKAIVGERLRPVYELVDAEPGEEEPESPAMADEEIIELLKTKFDASEVVPDEEKREETG